MHLFNPCSPCCQKCQIYVEVWDAEDDFSFLYRATVTLTFITASGQPIGSPVVKSYDVFADNNFLHLPVFDNPNNYLYTLSATSPDSGHAVAVTTQLSGCKQGPHLTGCPCKFVPEVLEMEVNDTGLNFGLFQNTTLVYGPTPPEFLPLNLGARSYLSVDTFTDLITHEAFRYLFLCYTGYYALCRVYAHSRFGSPFRDVFRYTWLIGIRGNTCSPFTLAGGQIYAGGDPRCVVTITGAVGL